MRKQSAHALLRPSPRQPTRPPLLLLPPNARHRSTSSSSATPAEPATAALSPRWLSDVKQRIGKCITFGMQAQQTRVAGSVLAEVARDWRELVAGSEGFLTSAERRGLYRQQVVWGEMDSMGHVNNVMYNRYAESGRVQWFVQYARHIDPANAAFWRNAASPRGEGLILRKITTEYKFPMKWPDHYTVYHKLAAEPTAATDAFTFDVVILSELHQRPAARVTEDCPLYDYRLGKKVTFKPFMIESLRETWRLQEEAKRVNSERVRGILGRVRRLEEETWDREGAVEDTGGAGG